MLKILLLVWWGRPTSIFVDHEFNRKSTYALFLIIVDFFLYKQLSSTLCRFGKGSNTFGIFA